MRGSIGFGFLLLIIILGIYAGYTGDKNGGPPGLPDASHWRNYVGILEGKNRYVVVEGSNFWWNDTGTYVTVKLRVIKPVYIGGIYTTYYWVRGMNKNVPWVEPEWMVVTKYGHMIYNVSKWLEPGVYTYTFPYGGNDLFKVDAFKVGRKWYIAYSTPTTNDLVTFDKHRSTLGKIEPMNYTVYRVLFPVTVKIPISKYFTVLVMNKTTNTWYFADSRVGGIREGTDEITSGEITFIPGNPTSNATLDEAKKYIVDKVQDVVRMVGNGLSTDISQVNYCEWQKNNRPRLENISNTIVIVQRGYCHYLGHCERPPVIRYDVERSVVSGAIPITGEGIHKSLVIIGKTKVFGRTGYLAEEKTTRITVIHNQTGTYVLWKTTTRYMVILGPLPKPGYHNTIPYMDIYKRIAVVFGLEPGEISMVSTSTLHP